jgi:predicted acyl esterase
MYGSMIVDDIPVPMDDGIVLKASVAFPTDPATGQRASGSFPVVIEHTPYLKLGQPVVPNTYLTRHGYIYAVVRARGMGSSGGDVAFFTPREGLDGKSIVDWAAHHLEGSDGRVALIGCSYPAGIALADAAFVGRASPLKTVIAACNGLNVINREGWIVGGLMTTDFLSFTAHGAGLMGGTPAAVKFFHQLATDLPEGKDPAYDQVFWRDRLPLRWAQNIVDNGIPILLWSGWQDHLESGALRTEVAFQNAFEHRPLFAPMTGEQVPTPRYQVIIGNWGHAAGLDAGIYLEWLETWLRGVDTGLQKTRTPLHLFEPGTNRWVNLDRYPVVANYTPWYLRAAGILGEEMPKNRGAQLLIWGDGTAPDGTLRFTTPPLSDGATLAGPIGATIYAASSNKNLEMIARLYDVSGDGSAQQISMGAVLGSQRLQDPDKSWSDQQGRSIWAWPTQKSDSYLTPNKIYRFDVALAPRQWGVERGHQLRLELTTQSPANVCPLQGSLKGNGTDPCGLTVPQKATVPGGHYTVLFGPQHPSALNLPQLPFNAFPSARAGTPPSSWSENQRKLETRDLTLPLDWGNE